MRTPTPNHSPKWRRPFFPASPPTPGSPPRAHLDLPILEPEFQLDPLDFSAEGSLRQTSGTAMTRPHNPSNAQLSTPPATVRKATPQAEDTCDSRGITVSTEISSRNPFFRLPKETQHLIEADEHRNLVVSRPGATTAQPDPQENARQSGHSGQEDDAVVTLLGLVFLDLIRRRNAVGPAADISPVLSSGSNTSKTSATISAPESGDDEDGEHACGDETADDASFVRGDYDAHSQFASLLDSPAGGYRGGGRDNHDDRDDRDDCDGRDVCIALDERIEVHSPNGGSYQFSPPVEVSSRGGSPPPSNSSGWSGSSNSRYTPSDDGSDDEFDNDIEPVDTFHHRSLTGSEPVEIPRPRAPPPVVVNLADMPDSDEEGEDWDSLDGIDDGPGKAAARRLGRKVCQHRHEASIYRLLRGGDVQDDRKKKKKDGTIPMRRVGNVGGYADVAKYFKLSPELLNDVKVFDDWARQYLTRGHGAALVLQSAFLRRSPSPAPRDKRGNQDHHLDDGDDILLREHSTRHVAKHVRSERHPPPGENEELRRFRPDDGCTAKRALSERYRRPGKDEEFLRFRPDDTRTAKRARHGHVPPPSDSPSAAFRSQRLGGPLPDPSSRHPNMLRGTPSRRESAVRESALGLRVNEMLHRENEQRLRENEQRRAYLRRAPAHTHLPGTEWVPSRRDNPYRNMRRRSLEDLAVVSSSSRAPGSRPPCMSDRGRQ
ncbi:hypothetical protein CspHIS471_0106340 [Cutaneotrichosporon sp. HIS471]|nr:hypothetical protein CspHIS471_0106340 [Cutaneotrichosporon sp. HIS471]